MEEYYQLKETIQLGTLILAGIIFGLVWGFTSLNLALNYLLGAIVGIVYLRLLAKDIEKLGGDKRKLGFTRLALVAGVLLISTKIEQLNILPLFLGFMTYKASILIYVLRTTVFSPKENPEVSPTLLKLPDE